MSNRKAIVTANRERAMNAILTLGRETFTARDLGRDKDMMGGLRSLCRSGHVKRIESMDRLGRYTVVSKSIYRVVTR